MSNYINLKTITKEEIESNTAKINKRTSNRKEETVYQTILNKNHFITWYKKEDKVYYYSLRGVLACIGEANNYQEYLTVVQTFFNKN